jgi:hypothetical protein
MFYDRRDPPDRFGMFCTIWIMLVMLMVAAVACVALLGYVIQHATEGNPTATVSLIVLLLATAGAALAARYL